MLVYEPEAAALYCRFQNMQNISNAKDESYLSKKKMLVFDMGGKQALFKLLIGFFSDKICKSNRKFKIYQKNQNI